MYFLDDHPKKIESEYDLLCRYTVPRLEIYGMRVMGWYKVYYI